MRETGRFEITTTSGESVRAFVPHRLPPVNPALDLEAGLVKRVRAAEQALVRLHWPLDPEPLAEPGPHPARFS